MQHVGHQKYTPVSHIHLGHTIHNIPYKNKLSGELDTAV